MTLARDDTSALMEMVRQGRLTEAEERARGLLGAHPSDGMLWKVLSVVLLPTPLRPSRPTTSPGPTSRLTPCRMWDLP